MSQEGTIHDSVLGVLRLSEEAEGCDVYEGHIDLTPKHRVVITCEADKENPASGLAIARETYCRIRREEWQYRQAVARELLPDFGLIRGFRHFFGEDFTAEEAARMLTLCRIDIDINGDWIAHYASVGLSCDKPIVVYFGDDGGINGMDMN
jgi:hypothetical protein